MKPESSSTQVLYTNNFRTCCLEMLQSGTDQPNTCCVCALQCSPSLPDVAPNSTA